MASSSTILSDDPLLQSLLKESLGRLHSKEGAVRAAQLGHLFWRIHTAQSSSNLTATDWAALLVGALAMLPPATISDDRENLVKDVKGLIAVLRKNPDRAKRFIDQAIRTHRDLRVSAAFLNQLPLARLSAVAKAAPT